MKNRRTIKYPDFHLPCPICGDFFKTPQGLSGHRRQKHGTDLLHAEVEGEAGTSTKALKQEVDKLKLLVEENKLRKELPSSSAETEDLMSRAGLGPFDAEVRAQVQRRAMALSQEPSQNWLSGLLAHPEAMKIAVDGLKGIFGSNQGDNMATLLKDLGFSLKDLIINASAPKSGALEIAGMNLNGVTLTEPTLVALLAFKATTEAAEKEYQGKKMMSDTLKSALEMLVPVVNERLAAGPRGKSISQKIMDREPAQPQRFAAECPVCGFQNVLDENGIKPGDIVHCQGKLDNGQACSESWTVVDPGQERKQRPIKKVEVQELPKSIPCESCGQLINTEGVALGSEVACPACQKVMVLTSPDIPMDPGPVEDLDPYKLRGPGGQFLHG